MGTGKKATVRILLFAVGGLLLIYGIWREEAILVFNKAVRICLECIGIG